MEIQVLSRTKCLYCYGTFPVHQALASSSSILLYLASLSVTASDSIGVTTFSQLDVYSLYIMNRAASRLQVTPLKKVSEGASVAFEYFEGACMWCAYLLFELRRRQTSRERWSHLNCETLTKYLMSNFRSSLRSVPQSCWPPGVKRNLSLLLMALTKYGLQMFDL